MDEEDTWMDQEAVKKLNGLFVNRIYVQHLGDQMMRLNFGEVLDPDDPSYHTALVISAANAKAFAELIFQHANAALAPPVITVTPTPIPPTEDAADGE